jgi:methylated-DNA-[protein]-cysteine S-methyltransferase
VNASVCRTDFGPMTIVASDRALTALRFGDAVPENAIVAETPLLREAQREISLYLEKKLKVFDLPLDPAGTAFMLSVWAAVRAVPWGAQSTYGDIARAIGKGGASRAVGMANNRNPLPIFIPCHRIIGYDGSLTGYGGGLELKERLLALEGFLPARLSFR